MIDKIINILKKVRNGEEVVFKEFDNKEDGKGQWLLGYNKETENFYCHEKDLISGNENKWDITDRDYPWECIIRIVNSK